MNYDDGNSQRTLSVHVEHLPDPTPEQWTVLQAHRNNIARRVLNMYSEATLGEAVTAGTVGVYWLTENELDIGTMCLEVVPWEGQTVLSVLWLHVEAGKLSQALKREIRNSWRQIVTAGDIQHVVIQGRPGWESVLINAGIEPKETARIWTFRASELNNGRQRRRER